MAMLNIFIEFIDGPYLHNQYRGWPMIIYEYIEVADIYISAKEIYGQYVAWPIKRNALLEAAVILNSACYWLFEQTNRQRGLYWVPKGVD
jgi:hypothetical protein